MYLFKEWLLEAKKHNINWVQAAKTGHFAVRFQAAAQTQIAPKRFALIDASPGSVVVGNEVDSSGKILEKNSSSELLKVLKTGDELFMLVYLRIVTSGKFVEAVSGTINSVKKTTDNNVEVKYKYESSILHNYIKPRKEDRKQ